MTTLLMRNRTLLPLYLLFVTVVTLQAQSLSPVMTGGLCSHRTKGNIYLSAAAGQVATTKLKAGGKILTQGFEQPQIQITTLTLPVDTICKVQTFDVPYKAWGFVSPNNVFTAQLSDGNGNFSSPMDLASVNRTSSGVINVTVPLQATGNMGTSYKIRVVGSAAKFKGKPSPNSLYAYNCVRKPTRIDLRYVGNTAYPRLKWVTDGDDENTPVIVERSTDGNNFSAAYTTLGESNEYDLNAANISNGITYYRISVTDEQGTQIVSNIVKMDADVSDGYALYPNPTNGASYLSSVNTLTGKLTLCDLSGKVVTGALAQNSENTKIDLSDLAAGVYILTYQDSETSISKKIVKE